MDASRENFEIFLVEDNIFSQLPTLQSLSVQYRELIPTATARGVRNIYISVTIAAASVEALLQ